MIEGIFRWAKTRREYLDTALLEEREQFLTYMLQQGCTLQHVKTFARALIHVVHFMNLDVLRPVKRAEIREAVALWRKTRPVQIQYSAESLPFNEFYSYVAVRWFRFHKVLLSAPSAERPFESLLVQFLSAMRKERGLSQATLRGYGERISRFLSWCDRNKLCLSSIRVVDVDAFIEEKRAIGWQSWTLASQCVALRTFFLYAEENGWCPSGIRRGIRSPRVSKYRDYPKGPPWSDVRRLIDFRPNSEPSTLRTHAILCLCSIYALRVSEVRDLLLSDFDWVNETFVVRRAKRGRIQHYPIQYEVGESILQYLRYGRPRCACRNLFVSTTIPYRPIHTTGIGRAIAKRAEALGLGGKHIGAHSLRHACATELLRKGSSLRDIADFLGHRDLRTVSVYARYDTLSLRRVADFSLGGLR